ncbi:MAG: LacI family transcriptional regulator [Herbaspirillum sp.]|jgi:LacI family transcriptional regulator|nr:LacI family transcriptional regulator [Herbaspirillum sp.]
MTKPPTLTDIAKAAGVHSSTVSRVMNPETRKMVSSDVAKRILAEAGRIGYRTNLAASTLRTRRSNVIGVVLPDITNAVFAPILMGIEEGLRRHGYLAIVVNVGNGSEDQSFVINRLLGQQVDGLIFATARRHDTQIEHCVKQRVPVITINRSEDSGTVSGVASDEFLGMRLAVEHLVSLNHTRIAHIAGPQHISTGYLRRLGFVDAIRDMKLAAQKCKVIESSAYSRESGRTALLELLKQAPQTTAVVAGNDLVALGCYDALKEMGLSCPGDISIVGHNDMPLMDMVWPPLTTVRIRHHDMGLEASRLILQVIENIHATVVDIRLKPELIVRDSTAVPRNAKSK